MGLTEREREVENKKSIVNKILLTLAMFLLRESLILFNPINGETTRVIVRAVKCFKED